MEKGTIPFSITTVYPGGSGQSNTKTLLLPLGTRISDLRSTLRTALSIDKAYRVANVQLDDPRLLIFNGASSFDVISPEGLRISKNQTLVDWFKRYRSYRGLLSSNKGGRCEIRHTDVMCLNVDKAGNGVIVRCKDSTVRLGPATLGFKRTLRVPDDGKTYLLPPDLGPFPLLSAADFSGTVPEYIAKRGGLLMPIFQREAMYIDLRGSSRCAIKISVGGINAITGRPRIDNTPPDKVQDYVVGGLQPWLDGICTASGEVRQFVALPLGYGYTIEEQLTGEAKHGGIQVDVYPHFGESVTFIDKSKSKSKQLDLLKTPAQLGLAEGQCINMNLKAAPPITLEDYVNQVGTQGISIQVILEGALDMPRGGCAGGPGDSRMGMAAGGHIQQKIYEDTVSVDVYDVEGAERLHIHTLSTKAWENITGVIPPITPIVPSTYQKHKLPWFSLYDEYSPAITSTGQFDNIKSMKTLDKFKHGDILDPDAPPPCSAHKDSTAACVVRPCDHFQCVACIGQALMSGMKCGVSGCDMRIDSTVGFKKPMAKVTPGGGSTGDWWKTEQLIGGVSVEERSCNYTVNVFSLMLDEDGVSPLRGKR